MRKLPIRIDLDESFLKAEQRCEYLVSGKQKRIWAVQLDLLANLLKVCKEYDIKIQVFAGTLLGAVRHDGFIPWDDDIDVAMDRPNFERLCSIGPTAFSYPYFFQTALTDKKHFFSEARLRNSLTTASVKGQESVGYNNGIYIDLFVLDGVTRNKILLLIQNVFKCFLRKLLIVYNKHIDKKNRIRDNLLCLANPILHCCGYENLYRLYHKVLAMYTPMVSQVGLVTHTNSFMYKYAIGKDDLSRTISHKFECIDVPICENYDKVLRRMYGDYMAFPPVEKRGLWHNGEIEFDPDVPYKNKLNNDAK